MADSLQDIQASGREATKDDAGTGTSSRPTSPAGTFRENRKRVRFSSQHDIVYFSSIVNRESESATQGEPSGSSDSTEIEEHRASRLEQWSVVELRKFLNYVHRLRFHCLAHHELAPRHGRTSQKKEEALKAIAGGHAFGPSGKTIEDMRNMADLLANFLDLDHLASTGQYRLYKNKRGGVVRRQTRKKLASFDLLVQHIYDNEPQVPLLRNTESGDDGTEPVAEGSASQTPSTNVTEKVSTQLDSAESATSSSESRIALPRTPAPAVATRGTRQQENPSDPADDDMDTAEMDEDESDLDENEEEDRYDCFHDFCFTAQYAIKNWSDRRLGYGAIEECSNRAATLRNIYLPPGSFSKRQKWTPRFLQSLRSIRGIDIEKAPRRNIKEHMMELKDLVTKLRDRYNEDRILRTSRKA